MRRTSPDDPGASIYGNIAVKVVPIRLSAVTTGEHDKYV
jgi:hypothetical protein